MCTRVHVLALAIVEQVDVAAVVSEAAADVLAIVDVDVVVVSFVSAPVVVVAVAAMPTDDVVPPCFVDGAAALDTVGLLCLAAVCAAVAGHAIVACVGIVDDGLAATAWYLKMLHALRGKCSLVSEEPTEMSTAGLSHGQRAL